MPINNLHLKEFTSRLKISEAATNSIVELLTKTGHFKSIRKAALNDDLGGVDWWVVYPDSEEEVPIQFKLRDKQKDIPIVRYQPFHGVNSDKTKEGRDYRGLLETKCKYYYVAVRNGEGNFCEVYNISCCKLTDLAIKLNDAWVACEKAGNFAPPSFFTDEIVKTWMDKSVRNKSVFACEYGDIWWKKNYNEASPKFNMYIPYSFHEWKLEIKNEV